MGNTNIITVNTFGFESQYQGFRIYQDGKILYKTDRTYLEFEELTQNNELKKYYNNRVKSFRIEEPKRAIKLNLNRNDNFYIMEKISDYTKGCVLYIHASNIQVEFLGDLLSFKTEHEQNFIDAYKLTFKYGFVINETISKEVDKSYKLEKNETLHTMQKDGETIYKITSYNPVEKFEGVFTGDYYTEKIESDFRKTNNQIAKDFSDILKYNQNFSHYDIEKLLAKFDITYKS